MAEQSDKPATGSETKPSATDETLFQPKPWWDQPTPVAIPQLIKFRDELRQKNLIDTEDGPLDAGFASAETKPEVRANRTLNGTYNDLKYPRMGAVGARFGRNAPFPYCQVDNENLLNPDPRSISVDLMTRQQFQPATIVNLLAAAWIQFETHDWFSHGRDESGENNIEIPLAASDPWPEHPMQVPRTPADPTPSTDPKKPPTFPNRVTHWWDGSQIYGWDGITAAKLRTGVDGKLKVAADGKLPVDPDTGIDLTAFFDNWWMGLSLLHGLFASEHNSICDMLRSKYPSWTDDEIYERARIINAALMAKIHTIEWTPAIVPNPTIQLAMRVNWHGIVGENLQKVFPNLNDSELLGGIIGSPTDHHAAPYSLTEEFICVYRMHALMPDKFKFVSIKDGTPVGEYELPAIAGRANRPVLDSLAMPDLFYSFGVSHPGAIRLHNFPRHLQHLTRDNGKIFDMAAVDILRDRERGVPRYNKFREMLRLPPIKSFGELTDNPKWAEEIEHAYRGRLDLVDAQVGLLSEPLPTGFGFSETAFRVFILMASRRLKSDRFFTTDYTPGVYTQAGLDWIENNGMITVLLRHHPELRPALNGVDNAFRPWKKLHNEGDLTG